MQKPVARSWLLFLNRYIHVPGLPLGQTKLRGRGETTAD